MFQRPELLILLALMVPLLLLHRRAALRFKFALKYFDYSGDHRLRLTVSSARLLALLLIVISAATPAFKQTVKEEVPLEMAELLSGRQVLLVIMVDVSKSMIGRLDRVKAVLSEMNYPNTTVHLATFSGKVRPVYSGTAEGLASVLPSLKAGERYTAIGDALVYARSYALGYPLPSAVILFSDGRQNYGSDPLKVARGYGVPLIVVAVDEVNVLGQVAALAEGKIYSLEDFPADYKQFAKELMLRSRYLALKAKGEAYVEREVLDYFPTLLALALSLVTFIISQGDGL